MPLARMISFAVLALAQGAAAADPPITFERHDLESGGLAQVTQGMSVGDLDGDGRVDLVVGGDRHLVLYHNPDWTPSIIADGYKFGGGSAVTVRDMNGDGRLDVVTGRYPFDDNTLRETVWYENTPSGWQEHLLSPVAYCHDVAFGDLDGDGRADMACGDVFRKAVAWLSAPADPTQPWTDHLIDDRQVQGAAIADIDRDGRLDVLSGRSWYRNEGGVVPAFTRIPLTTRKDLADPRFDDYAKITVEDIDRDGRLDVFATLFADSRECEVWAFLQPADPALDPWRAVQVDPGPLFGVHSHRPGDFDRSGRPQFMVGETNIGGFGFGPNPSAEIYVYRLVGDPGTPAGWERTLVDYRGTHEAQVVDLDGDGFDDIAGDEENTELITPPRNGRVTWWRNTTGVQQPGGPEPGPGPGQGPGNAPACTNPPACATTVRCEEPARLSLAIAGCACRAAGASVCTDETLPRSIERRRARACTLVERAMVAPADRVLVRRSRAAARALARIERALRGPRVPPGACRDAVVAEIDAARLRVAQVGLGQIGGP